MRTKCGICLGCLSATPQNTTDSSIVTTMCGHVFHSACIRTWTAKNTSCATCRKRVEEKDLLKLFIDFCYEKSERTLLDEFEEKLHSKDLECISKDKKISEMRYKCAQYESEISRKDKQIHEHYQRQIEYASLHFLSQMDGTLKDLKIVELGAHCHVLKAVISVKDRQMREFLSHSSSELESSKEDKLLKDLQDSYARFKLMVLEKVKMIEHSRRYVMGCI